MSIDIHSLEACASEWLQIDRYRDYCPNGLQVEGRSEIRRLICGVTASQRFLDAAIESEADAVLVHHGYFWKGEPAPVTGIKKHRLQTLLANDLNLLAYHLPLDGHEELGNNAQLAKLLDFNVTGSLNPDERYSVGNVGALAQPATIEQLCAHIERRLGRKPQVIAEGPETIQRVAWCTGAAQSMIDLAVHQRADVFISGEISEPTVHLAREAGIHYIAAGHHATERYGVQALGQALARKFDLQYQFIDIDNPV